MGNLTRDLVPGDAVSHAAQVFQQHHTQGGRQRPQLAQREFTDFLVGVQKRGEQLGVQHAVGVGHISPGNAIDTRQAFKWVFGKLGQVSVVTLGHAFLDLL